MIVALGMIFFGLRDSSPYTAVVSKPTQDQKAKKRPIAIDPAAAAVPKAPAGKASNAWFKPIVVPSINPSGPPPLKITEKASAISTSTSAVSVNPRIAAVRLMSK